MKSYIGETDVGDNITTMYKCKLCGKSLRDTVTALELSDGEPRKTSFWLFCNSACMGTWLLRRIETYDSLVDLYNDGLDGYKKEMLLKLYGSGGN